MGNSQDCTKKKKMPIARACYVGMHHFGNVSNFCTLSGPAGNRFRHRLCSFNGAEWGDSKQTGRCTYNDCDSMTRIKSGCCKHPARCCGITGKGGACKRVAFYGDGIECCLNNSRCMKKWEKNSDCQDFKGHTCSDGRFGMPDHRTMTGNVP